MYGIPVNFKAFDKESNFVGSNSLGEEIIKGVPLDMGLNPIMAFKSFNL